MVAAFVGKTDNFNQFQKAFFMLHFFFFLLLYSLLQHTNPGELFLIFSYMHVLPTERV